MTSTLDNVRIVLVRTRIASNLGATARAMANMGLSDLVLVAPEADPTDRRARQRASRAEALLRSARIVHDLADALDEVHWTVGATCRGGRYRQAIESNARQMAREAVRRISAGQRVAFLFGPEDNGLEASDMLACDAAMRIPSHDDYPSLNLATSVMVCAYELFVAAKDRPGDRPALNGESETLPGDPDSPTSRNATRLRRASRPAVNGRPAEGDGAGVKRGSDVRQQPQADLADGAMLARLMDKLRAALLDIGYLREEHPEHLLAAIRAVLGRAEPTRTEAQILMGLAQQIQEYVEYGPQAGRKPSQAADQERQAEG